MKPSRYAKSRQKSCQRCVKFKVKCDRRPGTCSRCQQLGITCIYTGSLPSQHRTAATITAGRKSSTRKLSTVHDSTFSQITQASLDAAQVQTSDWVDQLGPLNTIGNTFPCSNIDASATHNALSEAAAAFLPISDTVAATSKPLASHDGLDFDSLELVCPIDADEIRNRWLSSFAPVSDQPMKEYSAGVSSFIFQILKGYAGTAVRAHGHPPFTHWSQIEDIQSSHTLATCLSLVRICEKLLPGARASTARVLQREMQNIYQEHASDNDIAMLHCFQSYLVYSLTLQFWLRQDSHDFLRQAVMELQDLASASAKSGLVSVAEENGIRPRWESWIVAEAKRRTLYTMYLFDNVLSAQDGLPTCLGTELQGLPAPASKTLWQARSRHDWETAYNVHLAAFPDGGLRIDELWPMPTGTGDDIRIKRRARVDMWLEDLDEFGTMLYAVTSITHGV